MGSPAVDDFLALFAMACPQGKLADLMGDVVMAFPVP